MRIAATPLWPFLIFLLRSASSTESRVSLFSLKLAHSQPPFASLKPQPSPSWLAVGSPWLFVSSQEYWRYPQVVGYQWPTNLQLSLLVV